MISTRRIAAAVGLAVGVTGLAAPMANAAVSEAPKPLNPIAELDRLAVSEIPAKYQAAIPKVSTQLAGLNRLNEGLDQLHQVTDLLAPVAGVLPALEA
ncbi:hypothetical protein ACFYPC_29610 [Streptomyces sp. NPDC005808]|uniref:hypothetical protein n=1 Tax=Streptomyces sp. NPDC005808 TaxID=3364734 RepID=UPI00369976BF